jgi:transcription elongation GreA/GreB family factor
LGWSWRRILDQSRRERYIDGVSKAFTKEDDAGEQLTVERRPPPREPAKVTAQVAASGVVRAGALVALLDENSAQVEYQIVEPEAADATARRISVESPLGRALLGKRAGDQVVVERPRGPAEYEIVSVRY